MKKSLLATTGLATFIALAPMAAKATVLTFDLDFELSGAAPPAGSTPWLRATFDDLNTPGSVRLTIAISHPSPPAPGGSLPAGAGLTGSEFVGEFDFNLDAAGTSVGLNNLRFNPVSGDTATVNTGSNAFMADGDGKFDIQFAYQTANNDPTRFTAGDADSVYDIFDDEDVIDGDLNELTVANFDFFSFVGGGQGIFKSAAHIQGITDTGDGTSGWIAPSPPVTTPPVTTPPVTTPPVTTPPFTTPPFTTPPPTPPFTTPPLIDVPEPSTFTLFGIGLPVLAFLNRRRRAKK